jgi:ubiquitin
MFGALPNDHFAIPLYLPVGPENRVTVATREMNDVRAMFLKRH